MLTEFEVRTVSYGPNVSLLINDAGAKRAGRESTRKNEDPYRENEVGKIFIISLRLMGHALSNLAGRAVECGSQSLPIKVRVLTEKYNELTGLV